jgi:hypothetical protein
MRLIKVSQGLLLLLPQCKHHCSHRLHQQQQQQPPQQQQQQQQYSQRIQ